MTMLAARRSTFRAFAATVTPEMAQLDDAAWVAVERTVEHAIAQRPARMQRQLGMFLRIVEHLPRLRYGRGFSGLDARQRSVIVEALERAPVLLVRRGVWGLRTLAFMGYYTLNATMKAVGYRAHARGWEMQRPAQS